MQVHSSLSSLPKFRKAIITIGTFDGVHTGHQQILQQLKAEANAIGGESVIITFNPHPRQVLGNQRSEIKLINTLPEKIELLRKAGINHLVVVPFTQAFANQPAEDYVAKFLVDKFHPHTIIIGYDHRFGHNRQGNFALLEQLKTTYHYAVKEIPAHVLHNIGISSTKIRQAILHGNIVEATEFLGYPFFFEGLVIEGNKLGRTLGYPTANLQIENEDKLIPGNGVYAVEVRLGDAENTTLFKGMMNIGIRPTIGGTKLVIEVNIFDFDANIYGQNLRIYVHQKIRDEVKFNGLEALKEQLAKDKEASMAILG